MTDSILLLRDAIQAEHVPFTFDYLMFHEECWTLLRRMRHVCQESLNRIWGDEWYEKETQLPFIVGWIFRSASNAQAVETKLSLGESGKVMSKVLLEGAEAYNAFIEDGFGELVMHHQVHHHEGDDHDDSNNEVNVRRTYRLAWT
ncbi:hypothetical protein ZTR_08211 [Talaromyces verruculosus]|nr:hypothetical protein ZTR_08211 [Talaromyces verruculosus]